MAPEVRLSGPEGEPLGIVSLQEALRMAGELDVDLVEAREDDAGAEPARLGGRRRVGGAGASAGALATAGRGAVKRPTQRPDPNRTSTLSRSSAEWRSSGLFMIQARRWDSGRRVREDPAKGRRRLSRDVGAGRERAGRRQKVRSGGT